MTNRHLLLLAVAVSCLCWPPAENRSLAAQAGKTPITTFAELTAFLTAESVPHVADADKQFVRIPSKVGEPPVPALIRWNASDGLVHFVQPVPIKVPRHRLTHIETAVTRLNYGLELPGFGFDYGRGLVYYQLSIPIKVRGNIIGTEVRGYFSYVVRQAREFTEALDAVANQSLEGRQINSYYQQIRIGRALLGQFQMKLDNEQWLLSFESDATMTLARQGTVVVESTYELTGKRLRITDRNGSLACAAGERVGVYDVAVTDQRLTFVKVQDDCSGRSKNLTVGKWLRKQSAPTR
jgi:hypothetical protein